MENEFFTDRCRNCGGALKIQRMSCPSCGVTMEGSMELPRLARLSPEDRKFVEIFVLSGGSLKEVGRHLNLSYPTVRARLDRVIAELHKLEEVHKEERLIVLKRLERSEISVAQAAALLDELPGRI